MSPCHLHVCDITLHHNVTLITIHNLQFLCSNLIHSSISEKALVEYIGVCTDTYYGTTWFKIQNRSTSGCTKWLCTGSRFDGCHQKILNYGNKKNYVSFCVKVNEVSSSEFMWSKIIINKCYSWVFSKWNSYFIHGQLHLHNSLMVPIL